MYERIYIKHRTLDEIIKTSENAEQYHKIDMEMMDLIDESPKYKMVFLSSQTKIALSRFCTWSIAVINQNDKNENLFIYTIPSLVVDLPFEMFRAFFRAQTNQVFESPEEEKETYCGCLSSTTFKASLCNFIAKHFFDKHIPNPDLKETMIIRMNMFL